MIYRRFRLYHTPSGDLNTHHVQSFELRPDGTHLSRHIGQFWRSNGRGPWRYRAGEAASSDERSRDGGEIDGRLTEESVAAFFIPQARPWVA